MIILCNIHYTKHSPFFIWIWYAIELWLSVMNKWDRHSIYHVYISILFTIHTWAIVYVTSPSEKSQNWVVAVTVFVQLYMLLWLYQESFSEVAVSTDVATECWQCHVNCQQIHVQVQVTHALVTVQSISLPINPRSSPCKKLLVNFTASQWGPAIIHMKTHCEINGKKIVLHFINMYKKHVISNFNITFFSFFL